jgi:4-diphosphocytidyl-2-C-methyl-D-erythritol kinase
MILFPHAKINLGLYVISKRSDGFHNLETVFYPIPVCDVLEIVSSAETRFLHSGLDIPGQTEDNLVLRAYHLLRQNHPRVGPLDIYLHKAIPMGAGLGGGSSDAAEMLSAINRFFKLNLDPVTLNAYALELGSDCPFFLQAGPCFAGGRGEILEPINLDLSGYSIMLVYPEIHIKTSAAFSGIQPAKPSHDLRKCIGRPILEWRKTIFNVFETGVFHAYPSLRTIRDQLYAAGALYAAMTGSGSTIYGIFEKSSLPEIHFEKAGQIFIG